MSRTAKTAIPLLLALVWLPFVLQTDIYPLFRFGMFAEPIKRAVQTESFALATVDSTGKRHLVPPTAAHSGSIAYLMRNYYYRNQADTLLARLARIHKNAAGQGGAAALACREWQLLRVTSGVAHYRPDTVVVARLAADNQ